MNKFSCFLILIIFSLVAFVSCIPRINDGFVVGKRFEPAHTESNYYGEDLGWMDDDIPDRWYITFEKFEERVNKKVQNTRRVSQDDYNRYSEGDWIEFK